MNIKKFNEINELLKGATITESLDFIKNNRATWKSYQKMNTARANKNARLAGYPRGYKQVLEEMQK